MDSVPDLSTAAWMTAIRRDQTGARRDLQTRAWDAVNAVVKRCGW